MANTKIPSELVAINAISGTLIADNAITSVHIAENNITATQIAINAVTALQMADGTITSAKIADGTIVTADIADGQITTGKLADSSVTTGKIAAGTILGADIANNAILTQHIDDNQITADQIADNAVGVDQLAGITRGSLLTGNAAGNPSLLALGAANTLLQSDGTDLVFAPLQSGIDDNSNAVAITIDSSENVGIGTSNPSSILHLSAANDPVITLTDTGFGASADITGSNGNLRFNSQTATIFDMADSEVARIDSSGTITSPKFYNTGNTYIDSGYSEIHLQGSGTTFGKFYTSGGDFYINHPTQDEDIIFSGNDGGSSITALTLDMSEAGYATFNNNVRAASFSVGAGPTSELLFLSGAGHNGHGTTNARSVASFNTTGQNAGVWFGARNDETTGIIGTRTATGNLAFETYNSGWGERMRITYDGKVGIGTTDTYGRKFVVEGAGDLMMLRSTNAGAGGAQLDLIHDSASAATGDSVGIINFSDDAKQYASLKGVTNNINVSGQLHFGVRTDASNYNHDAMVIDNTGNVGIGTDSPSALLEIASGAPTLILNANTQATNKKKVRLAASQFTAGDFNIQQMNDDGTTVALTAMTIINGGNVGIGTTSPSRQLTLYTTSNISYNSSSMETSNLDLYMRNADTTVNNHAGIQFAVGNNSDAAIACVRTSDANAALTFGTRGTGSGNIIERMRIRSDGGIQYPTNNTFIATASGSSAYEWGAFRRPASSDGGQLTVRQYSSGDTAANYPAYASSNGSGTFDENTGVYFPELDQVGLTANGNPTLTIEDGRKIELYENGFTSGDSNRGQRVCLGGISHIASTNPGGTGSGAYLHIKTNLPHSNIMFRFEYKGISYDSQNMDTSIIGYTYAGVSYVHSPQIQDTGNSTYNFKTPYYSSDNKLVLVLQIANNYTGGVLWAQFVGSHTMAPGTIAIASCIYSNSTSGAF